MDDDVSIHAPPEGRDLVLSIFALLLSSFNPRAPGGARYHKISLTPLFYEFQSTRPRRGAIRQSLPTACSWASFNPRAPGGARFKYNDSVSFV